MTVRSLSLRVPAAAGLRKGSEQGEWEPAEEAQMGEVIAEVYAGRAAGEPVAEVAGSEDRVLRKALRFALELGMPVEVVIAGRPGVVRILADGTVVKKLGGGDV